MAVDMVLRLLNVFYESNFYLKINFTIFSSVKKKTLAFSFLLMAVSQHWPSISIVLKQVSMRSKVKSNWFEILNQSKSHFGLLSVLWEHSHELGWNEFFNCSLAALQPNLGHCREGSLTNPMLITVFFILVQPEGDQESCSEVGSESLAEHLVGFKSFQFLM